MAARRPLVLLALCCASSPWNTSASGVRGGSVDGSPSICQLKTLAQAQADIITNCGSKNAVISVWNECRTPILERAQRKIAETCCRDAVGSSGCEESSLPTEVYETDSPGGVPPKGVAVDAENSPA